MRLDLRDERLRARISGLADGRDRLVLDYPVSCRATVHKAFAQVLAPPDECEPPRRGRPRKDSR
jgi:hypothetical protein